MAEDWLPREPTPSPPRNQSARTFFIWAILILIFVAIYHLFSEPDHVAGKHPGMMVSTGYAGGWIILAAIVGIATPFGLLFWILRGSTRFNACQRPALEAIAQGDYARGVALLREILPRYRSRVTYWTTASYSLGYALTRAGDSAAAVGVLLGIERRPSNRINGLRKFVAIELARAFAIGGDVDKASKWLDAARKRTGDVRSDASVEAVHGLVLCREGHFDEALAHYEQTARQLEASLTAEQMCEAWLLRGFAIASTTTPRESGTADAWMQLVRAAPGEIAWLTAHWPALATFATSQGFAAATARASASPDRLGN